MTLSVGGGKAKLACECQAAASMKLCKHRLALLCGDTTKLSGDLSGLSSVLEQPEVVALRADCEAFYVKIDALESERIRIEAQEKQLKKDLAWRVTTGELK